MEKSFVSTDAIFMIPVLFFSNFSVLDGAPKTSTETVPVRYSVFEWVALA